MAKQYWLLKTEPDVFSIWDLEKVDKEGWDGVRNYQARNFMRDTMKIGDRAFIYHSNAKPPGIAGLAEIVDVGVVDPTQFDSASKYFDAKSDPENPRWQMCVVKHVQTFKELIPLDLLRDQEALADMVLLNRSRLSVQPVEADHFKYIVKMAKK